MFHRNTILLIIGAAMAGLLLVIVFGDNGGLELHRMRTTHARLLQENDHLTRENLQLYRTIQRMQHDPEFIENVARRELGMIRSDEVIFKFQSDSK